MDNDKFLPQSLPNQSGRWTAASKTYSRVLALIASALLMSASLFSSTANATDCTTTIVKGQYGQNNNSTHTYTITELSQITGITLNSGTNCSAGEYGFYPDTNVIWTRGRCRNAIFTLTGLLAGCTPTPDPDPEPAPGTISQSPLFLTSSVEPNILYILDDSQSMKLSYLPDEIGDESSSKRVKSSTYNTLYYNPDVTYSPPLDHNGNSLGNAAFTSAKMDGYNSGSTSVNLNTSFRPTWDWNGSYAGSAEPAYYYAFDETNSCSASTVTLTNQGPYGQNDNVLHTHTVSLLSTITGLTRVSGTSCTGAGDWGYNAGTNTFYTNGYCRNAYFNITGTPAETCSCIGNTGNDDCYDKVVVSSTSGPNGTDERTNFANWYSYYRTRLLTAKTGSSLAFATLDAWPRVGYGKINQSSNTIDGISTTTIQRGVRTFGTTNREQFFDWLFDVDTATYTPLRRALDAAGQYFKRTDDKGPYSTTPGSTGGENLSCRQNYTVLMTDGYWNYSEASTSAARSNNDGTNGPTITGPDSKSYSYQAISPFTDNYVNTLADVAMYYWKNDLTNLTNNVPTSTLNPAFWQHMVTFGVGLGVPTAIDPDEAFDAITTGATITWPDPETSNPAYTNLPAGRADELLHAAVNSRGGFFNAADASTFAAGLADALETIVARVESSATSAAASSAVLNTETLLYRAGFRSTDWSGTLKAYQIEPDGSLGDVEWDAEAELRNITPANRKLFTRDASTGDGVTLDWDNLSDEQQTALNRNLSNTVDNLGSARISWLRGNDDAHATFRTRTSPDGVRLLGDIINSHPQHVGNSNSGYDWMPDDEGTAYPAYRASDTYNARPSVIYAGANDGFIHAFDAESGEELFAYMPSELLMEESAGSHARVNRLMDTAYPDNHRYFTDGTVAIGDAYVNDEWKTVLVGTMGAGGRTVFALDVSDPGNFSASDVLWEFTDDDLGYKVGQPEILRLRNGEWVAVFGNGYGGATNRAHLFIVRLSDGQPIAKIDTGEGSDATPNGLGPTVSTDWSSGDLITNYIFAGDLRGNLWRFDVSGNENTWETPAKRQILFTATDPSDNRQPITAVPWVALKPDDATKLMVFFGTGAYFRNTDASSTQVQSLYGIVASDSTLSRDDLLAQTITWQGTETFGEGANATTYRLRQVSANTPDPNDTFNGWYVDLIYSGTTQGERVISPPEPPSGPVQKRVRFTSLIPDTDVCGSGRDGWVMDIDMLTGGRSTDTVFDLDGDGDFDSDDMVNGVPISGVGGTQGEPLTTIRSATSAVDYLYGGGTLLGDPPIPHGRNEAGPIGRQSWRQLR